MTNSIPQTKKRRRAASLERSKARVGWFFVLPFVLGFLIVYVPLIYDSIITSLSVHKGVTDTGYLREFVAFENYQRAILEDAKFTQVFVSGLTELLPGSVFPVPAVPSATC